MSKKSKLVFGDEITSAHNAEYVNYAEVKIKSFDKTTGGLMKRIAVFIYILTAFSALYFILSM